MLRSALPLLLLSVPLIACSDAVAPTDGESDEFLLGGKADSLDIDPTGSDACAILKLASIGPADLLDGPVKLNANTVRGIVAVRQGADPDDPSDDVRFVSLAKLDAAKYVGPVAFKRLLAFVQSEAGKDFAC